MKFFFNNFFSNKNKDKYSNFFKTVVYKQDFFVLFTKSVEACLGNKTDSGDSIAENVSVTSNR